MSGQARPVAEHSDDGRAWRSVEGRANLADPVLSLMRDPLRARGEIALAGIEARFLRRRGLPIRPGPAAVD